MRFFSLGCASGQRPYMAPADALSPADRLDLELHAASCVECAQALRDAVAVDAALKRAFAPLRARRTALAPGRVRMAVGPRLLDPRSGWLRAPALLARVAEVSVALGVTLFVITGSVEAPQAAAPQPRSVIREYFRSLPPFDEVGYFRWLRLARPDALTIARDDARLPVGGLFDTEPAEIQSARAASPR